MKNDTVSDFDLGRYLDSLRGPILNLVEVAERYRPRADRTVDDLSMALTAVIRCGGLLSRRAQRYMEVYRNQQYLTNEGQRATCRPGGAYSVALPDYPFALLFRSRPTNVFMSGLM